MLPYMGGSTTLSVTDDGQWRGGDTPQYAAFHSEKLVNMIRTRLSVVRQIRPSRFLADGVTHEIRAS